MELLIAGDLVPTKSNLGLFMNSEIELLLGNELQTIWDSADFRFFNLEAPITDEKSSISKCGPNLSIPIKALKGIKALNPSLISLANNHIFDQGEKGLFKTMALLKNESIPFIGAGDSSKTASDSYTFFMENKKIGIYACAEHEFGFAGLNKPGANPFDPLESFDHVKKLKVEDKCDYVIVIFHGGYENYQFPTPNLRKVCKKFVEKGADLVITQHSHCIGTFEEYLDSTIVYGQGNFIFDYSDNVLWDSSLLIKVSIEESMNIRYVPIVRDRNTIRLANKDESNEILDNFNNRSYKSLTDTNLEEQYAELSERTKFQYLYSLSNFNRLIRNIDRRFFKGFMHKKIYNRDKLLTVLNYIECESHRELLIKIIKDAIYNE